MHRTPCYALIKDLLNSTFFIENASIYVYIIKFLEQEFCVEIENQDFVQWHYFNAS